MPEKVPTMQVSKGATKVTINLSDLPKWKAKGFAPVVSGKPADSGEAGKPADGKPKD